MPIESPVKTPVITPVISPQPGRRLAPDILCEPQKKDLTRKIKEVFR
ncbi:MAG: hypothetical protein SV910_06475 [Chloroflexota bacterium]|nr:hypothetical protein [Chloroflexota bacterium]